jgi:ornithine carbamoyltransferase
LSISDLSPAEFTKLVLNASSHKAAVKAAFAAGEQPPKPLHGSLTGKTVAMMFNKRSTRTRVSTEAAVQMMSGHPMFLGKDDIQLGVCAPPLPNFIRTTYPLFYPDTNRPPR